MTKDLSEKMNEKSTSFDMGTGEEANVGYTPEEEKRVLRKIDRVILPLMCLVEFFQCESCSQSLKSTELTEKRPRQAVYWLCCRFQPVRRSRNGQSPVFLVCQFILLWSATGQLHVYLSHESSANHKVRRHLCVSLKVMDSLSKY